MYSMTRKSMTPANPPLKVQKKSFMLRKRLGQAKSKQQQKVVKSSKKVVKNLKISKNPAGKKKK